MFRLALGPPALLFLGYGGSFLRGRGIGPTASRAEVKNEWKGCGFTHAVYLHGVHRDSFNFTAVSGQCVTLCSLKDNVFVDILTF